MQPYPEYIKPPFINKIFPFQTDLPSYSYYGCTIDMLWICHTYAMLTPYQPSTNLTGSPQLPGGKPGLQPSQRVCTSLSKSMDKFHTAQATRQHCREYLQVMLGCPIPLVFLYRVHKNPDQIKPCIQELYKVVSDTLILFNE